MTEPFYIPVGTKLDRSVLRKITLEQMQSRDIFDPRFSGFEADFQWRDYINVIIPESTLRERVIGTLDQFAQTPEGQHMIRQAGAMQNYRMYGKVEPQHQPQARVVIGDGELNQHDYGVVSLNLDKIYRYEYRTAQGDFRDWSVQNMVFHELSHAMDAVSTKYNKAKLYEHMAMPLLKTEHAFSKILQERVPTMAEYDNLFEFREAYGAPLTEYTAIRATNHFMQRYYNEPPRALSHAEIDTAYQETDEEKLITPEALGADHYYDALISPPSTPPVAKAPLRKR